MSEHGLHIDNSIKKYFMSGAGARALETKDVRYVNNYLNTILGVGTTDVVLLPMADGSTKALTFDNFFDSLTQDNWSRLNFKDKAVICDWIVNDMFDKANMPVENRPDVWFITKESMNFKDMASYSKRLNRVYISPRGLDFKAVEVLRAVAHETKHAIDTQMTSGENLVRVFDSIFGDEITPENLVSDFINLDISQFPDEKSEFQYSKSEILLLKNLFSPIQPNTSRDLTKKDVSSFKDYREYMIKSAYYASPMEVSAHKESLRIVGNVIDENFEKDYDTYEDEHFYTTQANFIVDNCSRLPQEFNQDLAEMNNFMDLVIKSNFYNLYSGKIPGADKFAEMYNSQLDSYLEPMYDKFINDKTSASSNVSTSQMGDE